MVQTKPQLFYVTKRDVNFEVAFSSYRRICQECIDVNDHEGERLQEIQNCGENIARRVALKGFGKIPSRRNCKSLPESIQDVSLRCGLAKVEGFEKILHLRHVCHRISS